MAGRLPNLATLKDWPFARRARTNPWDKRWAYQHSSYPHSHPQRSCGSKTGCERPGQPEYRAAIAWTLIAASPNYRRSEEHTSELQSRYDLVCRLLLET